MAKTISELRNQSIQVRDASAAGENTATRVGTVLNDIVGHIEDYENTQSSNNSSQDAKIEGVKSSLNAEISRAKTEESNLSTQIGTERTERQAAVSREETARIQADNDEKTARQQADNAEQDARIKADNDEKTARQQADNAEQDARIKADNDEKTARENADITLRTMIQTEVSNRQIAVKQEEIRAMAAEKANTQAIEDENARATTAEVAETARAKAEEERLQGEIDNTNTNVGALENKVNSNHDHLTDEVARLDLTNNEIKADLEAETARAKAAEEANALAITDEVARAEAAEKANADKVFELEEEAQKTRCETIGIFGYLDGDEREKHSADSIVSFSLWTKDSINKVGLSVFRYDFEFDAFIIQLKNIDTNSILDNFSIPVVDGKVPTSGIINYNGFSSVNKFYIDITIDWAIYNSTNGVQSATPNLYLKHGMLDDDSFSVYMNTLSSESKRIESKLDESINSINDTLGQKVVYSDNRFDKTDIKEHTNINSQGTEYSDDGVMLTGYMYVEDLESVQWGYFIGSAFYPAKVNVVCYDSEKNQLTGKLVLDKTGFDVTNYSYIRVSALQSDKDVDMLVKTNLNPTKYIPFEKKEEQLSNVVKIVDERITDRISGNIVRVSKDGSKDFTTIRAAFESITDASETKQYIVEVYTGSYELHDEYTDAEFKTARFEGWFIPDFTTLKGIGEVVLSANISDELASTSRPNEGGGSCVGDFVSTINLRNTSGLENVKVTAYNVRYCVHDDSAAPIGGIKRIVKNCHFYKYKSTYGFTAAYGAGCKQNSDYLFENCIFESERGAGWSMHNNLNFTYPTYIKLKNCRFINYVNNEDAAIKSMGDGMTAKNKVFFENCHLQNGGLLVRDEGGYVGWDWEVSGSGNEPFPIQITTEDTEEEHYVAMLDETVTMYNNYGVPKGKAVLATSLTKVQVMNKVDASSQENALRFFGISLTEGQPGGKVIVKTKGYVHCSDIGFSNGELTIGKKIGVIDGRFTFVTDDSWVLYCDKPNFARLRSPQSNQQNNDVEELKNALGGIEYSDNRFDKNAAKRGYTFGHSSGVEREDADSFITDFMYVGDITTAKWGYSENGKFFTTNNAVLGFDKNKNRIGTSEIFTGTSFDVSNFEYIKITSGISNIDINMLIDASKDIQDYISYYKKEDALLKVKNYVDSKLESLGNVLWGKKLVSCGDSFTEGDFSDAAVDGETGSDVSGTAAWDSELGMNKTYPWWIAKRNNMTVVNLAKGGGTMGVVSDGSGNVRSEFVIDVLNSMPKDADYITIKYGINDSANNRVPLGNIDSTDNTTFYGAYKQVASWIVENIPNAKVLFIGTNGADTEGLYAKAAVDVAKKYGFGYIDLENDENVPYFFRQDKKQTMQSIPGAVVLSRRSYYAVNAGTNNHPNLKCHEYESTIIEACLRKL